MGCENELAETADAGGFSVSEAKNFYYKNTQSIYNDIGKTIDWESGVFHEFKDKKILEYFLYEKSIKVIVPVTNKTLKSEVNEILGSVFAKVVFIKTKDKIVMRELYYVPELNYLQKKNYEISETYFGEKNGDFSGLIFTENTNDEIILISKVKNAKIISSSFPSKGKLYEKHKLIIVYNRGGDGCIDGGTIEQVVISGNSSNNNSPYDWTGFNPYVEVPYVSPFDNPYASCEGPNCDGNGTGNNNGTSETTTTSNIVDKININENLNECSKNAYYKLLNANIRDIEHILKKLGADKLYNVTIASGDTGIANGNTISIAPFSYAITISTSYEGQTELYRASVLIHELTHAYFKSLFDDYHNGSPPNPNAYNNFSTLYQFYVDKNYTGGGSTNAHHEQMANSYITIIASALQEFQTGIAVYNSTPLQQVYIDLAWGGLYGTPIYASTSALTATDRIRIENVKRAEQSGHPVEMGTPNEQSPVGRTCN